MSSNSTDPIFPADTFGPDGQVVKSPYYEYLVSQGVAYTFVVLFSLTTAVHIGQAIYFRMWVLFPTVVLAGVGEILGWSGRLWSSYSPLDQNPYLMQIVATILAPTPFVAALFILFSRITQKLGTQYSRLSPRWYARIFLTADIIALVVQGAGGGLAATANTDAGSNLGANIMLGGIIFQLVALVIFIGIATEYYMRYLADRPIRFDAQSRRVEWGQRMRIFTGALVFIVICILIRSIYRSAELADGWNGAIITTQIYFNLFDAAVVLLAIVTLNFFHPGYMLKVDGGKFQAGETIVLGDTYNKEVSGPSTPNTFDSRV
ncbi:RTA1-domain-containing protein [Cristinia sonorae]|uniref:RTA1-domain-containing protein n=1 Tax=Cristinia sonorae TaxID=1940300 RepID=A0A8K0XLM0_9AGAR|nr:RTA1-domain-containing protein [Cristinia sonorae]